MLHAARGTQTANHVTCCNIGVHMCTLRAARGVLHAMHLRTTPQHAAACPCERCTRTHTHTRARAVACSTAHRMQHAAARSSH
eukprot:6397111-Alexandrium_andersonii.AAC.1